MFGAEVVVAYLAAWGMRKAHRLATRVDSEADAAMDAGLDRLHELVVDKLRDDPSLKRLESEAAGGEVSDRTRSRVQLALEDARDEDEVFTTEVGKVLDELKQAQAQGASLVAITQGATGNQNVQVADVQGTVTISFGSPPPPSSSAE